ncbi:hypothetical protein RHSP_48695 [Rhizobium freirei PRF 81]|uniref:Uncharacterized protein n=1 Tax=Rhizobium freirei PRF 81 TaxID=363754 RepID=N6UCK5_9HYPH|nr:hypothetical protein RHSP_48695 [Rhizobium freirei PRF 81]
MACHFPSSAASLRSHGDGHMPGQIALRLKRRHAAHPRCRDRLSERIVGHVPCGIDAFDAGRGRIGSGPEIAVVLEFQLALEELGRRRMTDGDENAVDRHFGDGAGARIAQASAGHRWRHRRLGRGAGDFGNFGIPKNLDVCLGKQAFLQDLFRAEGIAAMHHGHRFGDVGQIERFLDGAVAAADHDHVLVAIEEAVAGGAGGNAEALKMLFALDAEPLRLGASGYDERIGGPDLAAVGAGDEGALIGIDLGHKVVDDLGADMLGLLQHLLHQPRPLNGIGKARIVFDIRGNHQLAALFQAGDQNRLQHRASGIDSGRITGWAGADDEYLRVAGRHSQSFQFSERETAASNAQSRRFRDPPLHL